MPTAVMNCVIAVNAAEPWTVALFQTTWPFVSASTVMIAMTTASTGTVHFSNVRIA